MTRRPVASRRTGEAGLSMVEVFIGVVILAILAAVVVLAIGGASANRKAAVCEADARTIELADAGYHATIGKNTNYAPSLSKLMTATKVLKNEETLSARFDVSAPIAGVFAITGKGDCAGTNVP